MTASFLTFCRFAQDEIEINYLNDAAGTSELRCSAILTESPEPPPAPPVPEDFTTYTEVDGGNDITIDSATMVSWGNLNTRSHHTSYVYKDKGIDHFSGDLTHEFWIRFGDPGAEQQGTFWMLANMVGDRYSVVAANEDAHALFSYHTDGRLCLQIIENGSKVEDWWLGASNLVDYYIRIIRDDDGGVNNAGRLTAYIRTGSHSGVLQDTLVVDSSVGEQNDFRYLYAVASYNDGWGFAQFDGYTRDLEIGL